MKNVLKVLAAISFSFVSLVQSGIAQETVRRFPIVSSTLDKPFEIITGLTYYSVVDTNQGLFGMSTQDALLDADAKAMKGLEELAKKFGADAVINTSKQVLLVPGRGAVGEIILFGTAVKIKEGPK